MKKIAIPTTNGLLSAHFGHCEKFYVCNLDVNDKIIAEIYLPSPPHEPGLLPGWLSEQGVTDVIAGGMGQRAINLFNENKINVMVGAPQKPPRNIIEEFLSGNLILSPNYCNH